jgi:hypothetical protein
MLLSLAADFEKDQRILQLDPQNGGIDDRNKNFSDFQSHPNDWQN